MTTAVTAEATKSNSPRSVGRSVGLRLLRIDDATIRVRSDARDEKYVYRAL